MIKLDQLQTEIKIRRVLKGQVEKLQTEKKALEKTSKKLKDEL